MSLRADEANSSLRVAERLLAVEGSDLLRATDRLLADAMSRPGLPSAERLAQRASAAQHAWSDAMQTSLSEVRALRGLLSNVQPAVLLVDPLSDAAMTAVRRTVSLVEEYAHAAEHLARLATAVLAGDDRAASEAEHALQPTPPSTRTGPAPAGVVNSAGTPAGTSPCDPDETPRDCRARQQQEIEAERARLEDERTRTSQTILTVGRAVHETMEAVDQARQRKADADAAAYRENLQRMGAEGDRALAESRRRVIVTTQAPLTTQAPETLSTTAPLETSLPVTTDPPTAPGRSVGVYVFVTAAIFAAVAAGAAATKRYLPLHRAG